MPHITLTPEALRAVHSMADRPVQNSAVLLPDGNYSVPIDNAVNKLLTNIAFPGETVSDVILRITAKATNSIQ